MSRDYPARPSRSSRRRRDADAAGGPGREDSRSDSRREPAFRLFIAVEVPPDAVDRLVDWQQRFLLSDPVLRMTPAAQLHVTLAFLGQMTASQRGLAGEQLDGLESGERFEATVAGLAGLPAKRPHVIAGTVDEPSGRLQSLQAELTSRLVETGLYKREKQPYFPHVTLARARGRMRLDLAALSPLPVKFTAVRVTLYNSVLSASGALHEPIKTVQLN